MKDKNFKFKVGDIIIPTCPNKRTGDRSWLDDPLLITAIDLPRIVVTVLHKYKSCRHTGVVCHIDEYDFKVPSKEYIKEVLHNPDEKESQIITFEEQNG